MNFSLAGRPQGRAFSSRRRLPPSITTHRSQKITPPPELPCPQKQLFWAMRRADFWPTLLEYFPFLVSSQERHPFLPSLGSFFGKGPPPPPGESSPLRWDVPRMGSHRSFKFPKSPLRRIALSPFLAGLGVLGGEPPPLRSEHPQEFAFNLSTSPISPPRL